mmetsp:Transcript_40214/g.83890  ORF Transcript_40214/g.83890 Transcript_40214/m.83890 type:complete len:205 (+) Transcript_40214:85-699(+)
MTMQRWKSPLTCRSCCCPPPTHLGLKRSFWKLPKRATLRLCGCCWKLVLTRTWKTLTAKQRLYTHLTRATARSCVCCWQLVLGTWQTGSATQLFFVHLGVVMLRLCVCCWKLVQTKTKLVTMDQQQCSQLAPRATSKLFNYSSRSAQTPTKPATVATPRLAWHHVVAIIKCLRCSQASYQTERKLAPTSPQRGRGLLTIRNLVA